MTWDHPNMPWDESTIWVTELDEAGMPREMIPVAGGKQGEQKISVQQPQFSATGELFYISDESGYWNLYREQSGQSVCPREAEFGGPHWVFGMHHYEFLDSGKIICCYSEKNLDQLALLNPETGELEDLDLLYTSIGNLSLSGNRLLTVASSPTLFQEIIEIETNEKSSEYSYIPDENRPFNMSEWLDTESFPAS